MTEAIKTIEAADEQTMWSQVKQDLDASIAPFQYAANIHDNQHIISLIVEVDPGGGFEGSFETTTLTAPVAVQFTTLRSSLPDDTAQFRFAIHDESFIDKVGKFFGMEDIETGYAEFDKKIVVKTNDKGRFISIFADDKTRSVFQSLESFRFEISHYEKESKEVSLELTIDRAILNMEELKNLYHAFTAVLVAIHHV